MNIIYMNKAKSALINAKSELSSLIYILDDAIEMNDVAFQKNECNQLYNCITTQLNKVINKIIPSLGGFL